MFIIRVDHLSDAQLAFFGFIRVDTGDVFSTYIEPSTLEQHVIPNSGPRYLAVDDVNDAVAMSAPDAPIIIGPDD